MSNTNATSETVELTAEERRAVRWSQALSNIAAEGSPLQGLGHKASVRGRQRALALLPAEEGGMARKAKGARGRGRPPIDADGDTIELRVRVSKAHRAKLAALALQAGEAGERVINRDGRVIEAAVLRWLIDQAAL